jgi:hypothetical protein
MDNSSVSTSNNLYSGQTTFSNKNLIIVALVFLLVLSFLGINLLNMIGNFFQTLVQIFGPLITQILSIFGYTAGAVIDKSAEVVTDTTKAGIDIAGGSVQQIGELLKKASQPNVDDKSKTQLDNALNAAPRSPAAPVPDTTASPIQNPIATAKTNWCLVGEYQGRRGCIEIGEHDKCLSGQVFPEQKSCLNPTLTNNMNPQPIMKQ